MKKKGLKEQDTRVIQKICSLLLQLFFLEVIFHYNLVYIIGQQNLLILNRNFQIRK